MISRERKGKPKGIKTRVVGKVMRERTNDDGREDMQGRRGNSVVWVVVRE